MSPLLILLFVLSVGCDVSGQLCFKLGVDQFDSDAGSEGLSLAGLKRYFYHVARSGWLWCGIAIYIAEILIWLAILARADLSLAYTVASLNYCGVILASRIFLGERISLRRWSGVALITAGAMIVGSGG